MDDDGEDSEKDSRPEDDEDTLNQRVSSMLDDQTRYIQMCDASAQFLHMLSRLNQGVTTTEVLQLENLSDVSESSDPPSPSSQSPSADEHRIVIWAEPFMTCQLINQPSPPCCDMVRRLPPGTRPGGQTYATNPSSSSSTASSTRYEQKEKTSTQTSTSSAKGCQTNLLKTDSQKGCQTNLLKTTNTQTATASAEAPRPTVRSNYNDLTEAMLKISKAADTIRQARVMLSALTGSVQINNNNNPDVNNEEENSTVGGGDATPTAAAGENASNKSLKPGTSTDQPKPQCQQFKEPMLINVAEASAKNTSVADAVDSTRTRSNTENSRLTSASDSGISKTVHSSNQVHQSTSPKEARRFPVSAGNMTNSLAWSSHLTETTYQAPRIVRFPRSYGPLYRRAGNRTSSFANRTFQSTDLGSQISATPPSPATQQPQPPCQPTSSHINQQTASISQHTSPSTTTSQQIFPPNYPSKEQDVKQDSTALTRTSDHAGVEFNSLQTHTTVYENHDLTTLNGTGDHLTTEVNKPHMHVTGIGKQKHKITVEEFKTVLKQVIRDMGKTSDWSIACNTVNTPSHKTTKIDSNAFTLPAMDVLTSVINNSTAAVPESSGGNISTNEVPENHDVIKSDEEQQNLHQTTNTTKITLTLPDATSHNKNEITCPGPSVSQSQISPDAPCSFRPQSSPTAELPASLRLHDLLYPTAHLIISPACRDAPLFTEPANHVLDVKLSNVCTNALSDPEHEGMKNANTAADHFSTSEIRRELKSPQSFVPPGDFCEVKDFQASCGDQLVFREPYFKASHPDNAEGHQDDTVHKAGARPKSVQFQLENTYSPSFVGRNVQESTADFCQPIEDRFSENPYNDVKYNPNLPNDNGDVVQISVQQHATRNNRTPSPIRVARDPYRSTLGQPRSPKQFYSKPHRLDSFRQEKIEPTPRDQDENSDDSVSMKSASVGMSICSNLKRMTNRSRVRRRPRRKFFKDRPISELSPTLDKSKSDLDSLNSEISYVPSVMEPDMSLGDRATPDPCKGTQNEDFVYLKESSTCTQHEECVYFTNSGTCLKSILTKQKIQDNDEVRDIPASRITKDGFEEDKDIETIVLDSPFGDAKTHDVITKDETDVYPGDEITVDEHLKKHASARKVTWDSDIVTRSSRENQVELDSNTLFILKVPDQPASIADQQDASMPETPTRAARFKAWIVQLFRSCNPFRKRNVVSTTEVIN